MKNDVSEIPKFNSEREEAEWWDSNPDFVLQVLQQTKAEGRLGHGTAMRRIAEIRLAKEKNPHE